jgi:hypothetical protein
MGFSSFEPASASVILSSRCYCVALLLCYCIAVLLLLFCCVTVLQCYRVIVLLCCSVTVLLCCLHLRKPNIYVTIYRSSSYPTGNTLLLQYKDQPVIMFKKMISLYCENHKKDIKAVSA